MNAAGGRLTRSPFSLLNDLRQKPQRSRSPVPQSESRFLRWRISPGGRHASQSSLSELRLTLGYLTT